MAIPQSLEIKRQLPLMSDRLLIVARHGHPTIEGQIDLDNLVTKEYTLEQVNEGYDDMRSGKNIRGVIVFD